MIIKSNVELRKHLGGAVSTSLGIPDDTVAESDRILAYVPVAEKKFIQKAIGKEMLAVLESEYNSGPGVSAGNKDLFDLVQKACAFYTYAEYCSFSVGSDGDNGFSVEEKNGSKMWQVLERMAKSYELGSDMIEEAIKLLFTGDFAVFKSSPVWVKTYGLLINSGEVMLRALPASGGSYRLFLTLWPYFKDVEARECRQIMGKATYATLKTKRNGSNETLSDAESGLLEAAEKLVAHAAYFEALPEVLVVSPTTDGHIRVLSDFDGIRNRNNPKPEEYARLLKSIEKKRDRYRNELKAYLDENLDHFPDYKSEMYRGSEGLGFLDNDKYNTLFSIR